MADRGLQNNLSSLEHVLRNKVEKDTKKHTKRIKIEEEKRKKYYSVCEPNYPLMLIEGGNREGINRAHIKKIHNKTSQN